MKDVDLIAYTQKAKELEAAVYTEKRLMKTHESILKEQYPPAPKKREIKEPAKPRKIDCNISSSGDSISGLFVLMAIVGYFGLLILFIAGFNTFIFILCFLLSAVGTFFIVLDIKDNIDESKRKKEQEEAYKREVKNYPILMDEYNKNTAIAEEDYRREMDEYRITAAQYDSKCDEMRKKHRDALALLENSLKKLYDADIIFPKYRNLVAVAAINEYLESGRCERLEGADGAYNLYEMELRQNIVIGQLNQIVSNLEQIRSNQYSLYEELQRSNMLVNAIAHELRDMKNDTKLLTYFSGLTAVAELSPKFIFRLPF